LVRRVVSLGLYTLTIWFSFPQFFLRGPSFHVFGGTIPYQLWHVPFACASIFFWTPAEDVFPLFRFRQIPNPICLPSLFWRGLVYSHGFSEIPAAPPAFFPRVSCYLFFGWTTPPDFISSIFCSHLGGSDTRRRIFHPPLLLSQLCSSAGHNFSVTFALPPSFLFFSVLTCWSTPTFLTLPSSPNASSSPPPLIYFSSIMCKPFFPPTPRTSSGGTEPFARLLF